MPKLPKKILVIVLKKLDLASAIAVRLTKYTGKSKEFIHPKHLLSQKPWFTRYLGINDVVLDLGSGNGQNSIKAAKIANKVIGIEIDEDLLKIAQSIKKQKKVKNVEFTQGNLEDKLPYKNITFDKILRRGFFLNPLISIIAIAVSSQLVSMPRIFIPDKFATCVLTSE